MKNLMLLFLFVSLWVTIMPRDGKAQQIEERQLEPFRSIRVGQAIKVYLQRGKDQSVTVEAQNIPMDRVLTEVSEGHLKIRLAQGRFKDHSVKVYVTTSALNQISASSAAGVFSRDTLEGKHLTIRVSSAADVDINVKMEEIEASVSSSGDLQLSGKTDYLEIDVSSAGGVNAFDLNANRVKVNASSAGGAKVSVNEEINAQASSGGSIRYRGRPASSRTDTSSGGSVRKAN